MEAISPESALAAAIDKIGSQGALARLLGISQPAVWKWVNQGKALPPEHVLAVEAETGISRHVLRPDIYPRETPPPPRATRGDAPDGAGAPHARPAGNPAPSASPFSSANPIPSDREGSAPAADCLPAAGVDHAGDRRS